MLFIIKAHKYKCINGQVDKLDKIQMGHDAEKTLMKELNAKKAPIGDMLDMVSGSHGVKMTIYHSNVSSKYRKIIMNKNSAIKSLNSCKKKGLKARQVLAVAEEDGTFSFFTHNNFESIHWSKMKPWKPVKSPKMPKPKPVPVKPKPKPVPPKPKPKPVPPKPKTVPKKIKNVEKPDEFVAPKKRPPARTVKTGGVQFRSAKHQKLYGEFYDKFMADLNLKTVKDFKRKWKSAVSLNIRKATTEWKNNTTLPRAIALKVKAEQLESGIKVKTRVPKTASKHIVDRIKRFANEMKDKDYLEMRALSQAYFDKNNIKELKLYRGTDGRTGEKIAKKVRELKLGDTVTITDNSLVGYSSEYQIADGFGTQDGGVTTRVKFKTSDILIPDELWPVFKGAEEFEYMCIGSERKISITDITAEVFAWLKCVPKRLI